jgi:NTE family protein
MSKINRKKIGLALGGGGAKGFAHIGVLKVLEENNIPIDFIAGTSIGALVGSFYSASKDVDYVRDVAVDNAGTRFTSMMFELTRDGGLVKGDKVLNFLKDKLDEIDFNELQIPLAITATELNSGSIKYFEKKGDVAEAIRASISYPPIFSPVKIKNKLYVDGGLSCQVPVDKVREMGADIVIAVDLENNYVFHQEAIGNTYKIFRASIKVLIRMLSQYNTTDADIVIRPPVGKYRTWMDFDKASYLIKIGENSARKALKDIKRLL